MKRIIAVTGASGHLGNVLVKRLVKRGESVRALLREPSKVEIFEGYDVDFFFGDVCEGESLEPFLTTGDGEELILIHTAGIVSTTAEKSKQIRDVNVGGTRNIADKCLEHSVKKLIYVSSVHAIEAKEELELIEEVSEFDPSKLEGIYAKTKAQASQLVLDSGKTGLDVVIVHPSGIIGPEDYKSGHTTQLIEDYLTGRLGALVNGGYNFVDVRDVADGIIQAIDRGRSGESYILSGVCIDIKDLISKLSKYSGKKDIKITIPMWLAKLTASMSEVYYRLRKQKPMYSRYSIYTLTSNSNFSNEKAKRELGFEVRDLDETIRDTLEWLGRSRIR